MKPKFLTILLLAFVACDSPTVPEREVRGGVFDFRLLTPQPKVLRWPTGSTVRVFAVADQSATLTQWLQQGIAHAAAAWNRAALYNEVHVEIVSALSNADVVVEYTGAQSPLDLSRCAPGTGRAVTTFCLTADGNHLEPFPLLVGGTSTTKFVVSLRSNAATDEVTVRRLLSHEMGHVLGIGQHSLQPLDLMYSGDLARDDPNSADRATFQVLYHTVPDITP